MSDLGVHSGDQFYAAEFFHTLGWQDTLFLQHSFRDISGAGLSSSDVLASFYTPLDDALGSASFVLTQQDLAELAGATNPGETPTDLANFLAVGTYSDTAIAVFASAVLRDNLVASAAAPPGVYATKAPRATTW